MLARDRQTQSQGHSTLNPVILLKTHLLTVQTVLTYSHLCICLFYVGFKSLHIIIVLSIYCASIALHGKTVRCLSACNQVLGSGDEPVRSLGSKWPPPSSSSHVSDDTWGSASDRRSAGHLGQLTINTGWNVPSASATPRHMQVCLLTRSACGSVESLMTVKKQTSKIDIVDKN